MKFFLIVCLLCLLALSASAGYMPPESECRSCECKCRRARRFRRRRSPTPTPVSVGDDEEDYPDGTQPESESDDQPESESDDQPESESDDQPDESDGGYPSGQGSCVTCSKDNMEYVNKYRMSMGMGSLHWDEKLANWADEQSRTMFMQKRLFHSDHGLWENVAVSGYPTWPTAAESFFEQWRESPGHNSNMLVDSHQCMGAGIYGDGHQFYATQIFSHECE